jgi:hypothetical protein
LTVEPRLLGWVVLLLILAVQASCGPRPDDLAPSKKHVLLVGASVGKEWRLAELPLRVPTPQHSFESVAVYQFDKTEALEAAIIRPRRAFRLTRSYFKSLFGPPPRRPDMVILKECAAYFPGDRTTYEALVAAWVKSLRSAGIAPALATVAPVSRSREARQPGQLAGIMSFNAWLREFATSERLPVVDINAALGGLTGEGYLTDELTSGDGLHLSPAAYRLLDAELVRALRLGTAGTGGGR